MKKLFVLFLFLSVTMMLQAQTKSDEDKKKKKVKLLMMLMFGVDFPNISESGGDSGTGGGSHNENKMLPGGQFGAGFNIIDLSDVLGVRTEIIYSMQGTKSGNSGDYGYNTSDKTRLNYLICPVTTRYQNKSGFFAEAGLQPGFLLSAKNKYSVSGTGGSSSGNTDVKDEYKKFDMGLPVGVGYEFKNKIGVGLRVTPGLSNIHKSSGTNDTQKQRNFVGSFRATYSF